MMQEGLDHVLLVFTVQGLTLLAYHVLQGTIAQKEETHSPLSVQEELSISSLVKGIVHLAH